MLLPGLNTQTEYVNYAKQAGLSVFSDPFDISKQVSKTWYVLTSLSGISKGVHRCTVLTHVGIFRGRLFKILGSGLLPFLRVEMA